MSKIHELGEIAARIANNERHADYALRMSDAYLIICQETKNLAEEPILSPVQADRLRVDAELASRISGNWMNLWRSHRAARIALQVEHERVTCGGDADL